LQPNCISPVLRRLVGEEINEIDRRFEGHSVAVVKLKDER
jgi:hypothetical protein